MDLLLAFNVAIPAEVMKDCQVHFVVILCQHAGKVQRLPVPFGLHSECLPPVIPGPAAGTVDLPADAAVPGYHPQIMA